MVWKIFLISMVYFFIINCCIYSTSAKYPQYLKSSFIQLSWTPIALVFAIISFIIFGKNLLKYIKLSLFFGYIFVFLNAVTKGGFFVFFTTLYNIIFKQVSVDNYFEVSAELIFSAGLLLIYLLFKNESIKEKNLDFMGLLLCIMIVVTGFKRIQIISLGFCILLLFIFLFAKQLFSNWIKFIVGFLSIVFSFIYVYWIDTGSLSLYLWKHGIDSMGRVKMYEFMGKYYNFGLNHVGNGFNFSNFILQDSGFEYNLHSDILKIFVDLGFCGLLFFLIYIFLILYKRIERKFNYTVSNFYFVCTFYMFVLYFTDNALTYFLTQATYLMVVLLYTYDNQRVSSHFSISNEENSNV
ncbi:oligosaccharide repeat unit polymerase Wzy [Streptococcus sp. HSISB1]|nr:oligosaccharide repeat unit polymerase Wzy [Streptococcus sp. HSISB1]